MQVAFIVQNLAHKSDSVGYDCIFQYKILKNNLSKTNDIRIFADVFDEGLHPGIPIEPMDGFWDFHKNNPQAYIIYHFCDGWNGIDDYIVEKPGNFVVRWHNNTTPWFYVPDYLEFASGCLRGFEVVSRFVRAPHIRFLVNSEFSAKQLMVLDGKRDNIHTVFPISPFLEKKRETLPLRYEDKADHAPIKFLFVSRVAPHKGQRHVLSIAAAVRAFLGREVKVKFVGALEDRLSPYWQDLGEIAYRLGVPLTLTGLVSDEELAACYREADVFVCMSEHEGFGLPVFEAMRFGLPVVAWATSAMADLLGEHPLAPDQFDIAGFAACAVLAIDPQYRKQLLEVQERILETYTYDVVIDQLVTVMEDFEPSRKKRNAVPVSQADQTKSKAHHRDLQNAIRRLTFEIDRSGAADVEIFDHDAATHFLGRYDIGAFSKLISLMTKGGALPEGGGRGESLELHPFARFLRKLHQSNNVPDERPELRLENLMQFDDETFVRLSFLALLQREVDQKGIVYYSRLLRKGFDKEDILRLIALSEEGRKLNANLPGLDLSAPIQANPDDDEAPTGWARWSQRLMTLFRPRPIADPHAKRVARIESGVNRLGRYLIPQLGQVGPYHPMGPIHHVQDLLRLNDADFVAWSYRLLLGRNGDPGGIEYWSECLADGLTREAMLRAMAHDSAAGPRIPLLAGLDAVLAEEVPEVFEAGTVHKGTSRQLMRIENELGRIIQLLAVHGTSQAPDRDNHDKEQRDTLLKLMPSAAEGWVQRGAVPALSADNGQHGDEQTQVTHLHQILITHDGGLPDVLPPLVQRNVDSLRNLYPNAAYRLWGRHELRQFIADNFPRAVVEAFDDIQPFAYKADLARYCLLYIYGGLYSDLSNRFFSTLPLKSNAEAMFFREHRPLHGAFWMVQNTIIYAVPRIPEMKLAIDLILDNVKRRDYGVSSLAPTGPVLFGRVFAAMNRSDVYEAGQSINLQVDGALNRSCYIGSNGTLVAARLQGGGGRPSEMGLRGTNVYGEMWDRREVYGEGQMHYPHDHPRIGIKGSSNSNGALIPLGSSGIVIYGPYAELPPGKYTVAMNFVPGTCQGKIELDVCHRAASQTLAHFRDLDPGAEGRLSVPLELAEYADDLEVRLHVRGDFTGVFTDLQIIKPKGESVVAPASATVVEAAHISDVAWLHQIEPEMLSDSGLFGRNAAALRSLYPEANYRLWTMDDLHELIQSDFSKDVSDTFDSFDTYSEKYEFAQYCILYRFGGLFVGEDICLVQAIELQEKQSIACFRLDQPAQGASWALDSGLILVRPKQEDIRETIERVTSSKTNDRLIGRMADILGQILTLNYKPESYGGGEVVSISRGLQFENTAFVDYTGRLVAVRQGN